jgi:hypothetical protein
LGDEVDDVVEIGQDELLEGLKLGVLSRRLEFAIRLRFVGDVVFEDDGGVFEGGYEEFVVDGGGVDCPCEDLVFLVHVSSGPERDEELP